MKGQSYGALIIGLLLFIGFLFLGSKITALISILNATTTTTVPGTTTSSIPITTTTTIPSMFAYSHYHLNETSGTNAYDSSGNNRNCTTVNSPTWITGKLNNSLKFDGIDDYVNCGNIASFERNETFSYEFWINYSTSALKYILSKTNAGRGTIIFINGGLFNFILEDNVNYIQVRTISTFNDNYWHHVVITYDGSSLASGVKIYVDSVSQTLTIDKNNLAGTTINIGDFIIASYLGSGYFYGEKIDEIVIYNYTLTQANVTLRWNSGTGIEEPPL